MYDREALLAATDLSALADDLIGGQLNLVSILRKLHGFAGRHAGGHARRVERIERATQLGEIGPEARAELGVVGLQAVGDELACLFNECDFFDVELVFDNLNQIIS